jgi:hypothetical protein
MEYFIDEEIISLEKQKEDIIKKIDEKYKESLAIKCRGYENRNGCGKYVHNKDIKLENHYYYVSPTGCCGGDFNVLDEYRFVCPYCGVLNRFSVEIPTYMDNVKNPEMLCGSFINKFLKYLK